MFTGINAMLQNATKEKTMDKLISIILMIMGTLVATLNLTMLVETNPDYSASWLKVAFCGLLILAGVAVNIKGEI